MTTAVVLRHYCFSPPSTICHPSQRLRSHRSFSSCPFQILGFKRNNIHRHHCSPSPSKNSPVTYEEVRASFRKLALLHHPDTAARDGADTSYKPYDKKSASVEFTRIREAFEAIVEGPAGMAVLRCDYNGTHTLRESHENKNNNNTANHHEQNTFLHPSVNPQVLHEVLQVAKTMNPAGLDRGGMWQYANMIRHMAEDHGKGLPPLRIDHAANEDEKKTRRRRKK